MTTRNPHGLSVPSGVPLHRQSQTGGGCLITALILSAPTDVSLRAEVIVAKDDAEALSIAKQFVDGHDVELWQLDRKIGVLHKREI